MRISYSLKALATQVATIIRAAGLNVSQWNGTNVAAPDTAGYPKSTIKSGTGTGEIDLSAGAVKLQSTSPGTVKSVQYGSISLLAGVASATYTCSPSVGSKARVGYLGAAGSNNAVQAQIGLSFAAGVVTAIRTQTVDAATVYFEVTDYN